MMTGINRKSVFGLIVLVAMAGHYALLRVPFVGNDFGRDIAEWPLLADLVITFPLLYYFMFRPSPKAFFLRWLTFAALSLWFGSLMIPDEGKVIWRGVERLWPLYIALQAALELYVLVFLVRKIRALARMGGDVDEAMEQTIRGRLGRGATGWFALFEARIWYYGLFMRKGSQLRLRGEQHFSYDKNEGNASNQIAVIMMLLFEMPLSHLLLHLVAVKPVLAWIVDGLTLWSMLYIVAEYRATHWRPVSLDKDALLIRYGVFAADRVVPYWMVESISRRGGYVPRERGVLRLYQFGGANVEIRLRPGSRLPGFAGREQVVTRICIGIDKPDAFIDAVRAKLQQS
ncbi:hypothetical protein SAMN05428959_1011111 [Duganella sp. CF517]|uniref:hypothetical protein n=1 Tax=Duganella sp. CF517 TaxID=1881038 RepID=UPI0008CD17C6|nr:hypothetical protein [Duganella sp. CF517]SEN30755.1 hypothetical protein SAMN05428959_1011111 [Duganella sp. CF517]